VPSADCAQRHAALIQQLPRKVFPRGGCAAHTVVMGSRKGAALALASSVAGDGGAVVVALTRRSTQQHLERRPLARWQRIAPPPPPRASLCSIAPSTPSRRWCTRAASRRWCTTAWRWGTPTSCLAP